MTEEEIWTPVARHPFSRRYIVKETRMTHNRICLTCQARDRDPKGSDYVTTWVCRDCVRADTARRIAYRRAARTKLKDAKP